jgi:hypothetical protein
VGDFLKNFSTGVGSILEILPRQSAAEPAVRLRSVEEALAGDWERVGAHLRRAMEQNGVPTRPVPPHGTSK